MIWIYAVWIVANVANYIAVSDWPVVHFIRNAVGFYVLRPKSYSAIPMMIGNAQPRPASIPVSLLDVFPKSKVRRLILLAVI